MNIFDYNTFIYNLYISICETKMLALILGLHGSGKSSVLKNIQDLHGLKRFSFGDFIKENPSGDPWQYLETNFKDIDTLDGPNTYDDLIHLVDLCKMSNRSLMVFWIKVFPVIAYKRMKDRNRKDENIRRRLIISQKCHDGIYDSRFGYDYRIIHLDGMKSATKLSTIVYRYIESKKPLMDLSMYSSHQEIIEDLLGKDTSLEIPGFIVTDKHLNQILSKSPEFHTIYVSEYYVKVWYLIKDGDFFVINPNNTMGKTYSVLINGSDFKNNINLKEIVDQYNDTIIEGYISYHCYGDKFLIHKIKNIHRLAKLKCIQNYHISFSDLLILRGKDLRLHPYSSRMEYLKKHMQGIHIIHSDCYNANESDYKEIIFKPWTSSYFNGTNPLCFNIPVSKNITIKKYWDPKYFSYESHIKLLQNEKCHWSRAKKQMVKDRDHWFYESSNRWVYKTNFKTHWKDYYQTETPRNMITITIHMIKFSSFNVINSIRNNRKWTTIISPKVIKNPLAKHTYPDLMKILQKLEDEGKIAKNKLDSLLHYNRIDRKDEQSMNVVGLTIDPDKQKVWYPMPRFTSSISFSNDDSDDIDGNDDNDDYVEYVEELWDKYITQNNICTITPKMDGSMIMAFIQGYKLIVKTKKRTTSYQAIYAKEWMIKNCKIDMMKPGIVYCFESCFQNNRLVVEHQVNTLFLLCIINNGVEWNYIDSQDFAIEFGVPMVARFTTRYKDIMQALWHKMKPYRGKIPLEGFVVMGKLNGEIYRKKLVFNNFHIAKRGVMRFHPKYIDVFDKAGYLQEYFDTLPSHYNDILYLMGSDSIYNKNNKSDDDVIKRYENKEYPIYFLENYYKSFEKKNEFWKNLENSSKEINLGKLSINEWKSTLKYLCDNEISRLMKTCRKMYYLLNHIKPMIQPLEYDTKYTLFIDRYHNDDDDYDSASHHYGSDDSEVEW